MADIALIAARALANELSAHDDGSITMRRERHAVAVRILGLLGAVLQIREG